MSTPATAPSCRLAGRVAIVTGAASGIGQAVALLFAAEGARVALVDLDEARMQATAGAITTAGGTASAHVGDVADAAFADATVAAATGAWQRVDVLVTAAGISVGRSLRDTASDEWDRVFAVNVKGTFVWLKAVLPGMVERRRGAIVTVGSQLALAGGRGSASYIASKGAVISLTRAVALDHAIDGIRANVLVPGAIETPMLERSFARAPDPAAARERSRLRHPLERFGTPAECAQATLWLASDEASFTTGAILPVDGGWLTG